MTTYEPPVTKEEIAVPSYAPPNWPPYLEADHFNRIKLDRGISNWPGITEDAITPMGFGRTYGNLPCFATKFDRMSIYLTHDMVPWNEPELAFELMSRIVHSLENFWEGLPGCRCLNTQIDGKWWYLYLNHVFSHFLVQKRQKFTIQDVLEAVNAVQDAKVTLASGFSSPLIMLKSRNALYLWLLATRELEKAKVRKDDSLFNSFWELCEKFDFLLSEEDRRSLIAHLDDQL